MRAEGTRRVDGRTGVGTRECHQQSALPSKLLHLSSGGGEREGVGNHLQRDLDPELKRPQGTSATRRLEVKQKKWEMWLADRPLLCQGPSSAGEQKAAV